MTGIGVLLPLVSLLLRLIGSPVWSELAAAVDLNLHSTQSGSPSSRIHRLGAVIQCLPNFSFEDPGYKHFRTMADIYPIQELWKL